MLVTTSPGDAAPDCGPNNFLLNFDEVLPRPLYRSLTLWSGVLVITFLSWAWWDSFRHDTWRTESHFACSNVAGAVSLGCYQANFGKSAGRRDISLSAVPRPVFAALSFIDGGSKVTVPAYEPNSGERLRAIFSSVPSGFFWFLNVPHWLLILSCLVPWLSLLAWRRRRVRRLTDTQNEHHRIAVHS